MLKKTGGAEIKEEPGLESGAFEIAKNLRLLTTGDFSERLQFDDDLAITNKVRTQRGRKTAPLVEYVVGLLTNAGDAAELKLDLQGILKKDLVEPAAEFAVNFHGGTDDGVGSGITVRRFRRLI